MGYFASFETLKVPNLKVHEAELVKRFVRNDFKA